MLYVLYGEDDFSARQCLAEIRRGLGDPSALANNTAIFGADVTLDQLRAACQTMPFLGERRLAVIEGLLERFEPRPRAAAKKRPDDHTEEIKSLAGCLASTPDFAVVVTIDGKIGARNPLLTALSGKAQVKAFPAVRGEALKAWIRRRVTSAGGIISPSAVDLLARLVGGNLWVMSSEIDKLMLFTRGKIEEKDVKAVASSAQEASIFSMVDAVLEARPDAAGQMLQSLLEWGAAPPYVLSMLSRQAQMIVRAKDMVAQGKPRAEIQQRLGLADFALNKTMIQAARSSDERLREVYHKLLEADLSIKTGQCDGKLALSLLVAELGRP